MSTNVPMTASADDDLPPLLDRACAGDSVAVERLIDRFRARVQSWAARITGDTDSADDVAQDVLAGLGQSVRTFDRRGHFSTWLFAVTRRAALSDQRRESRRRTLAEGMIVDDDEREARVAPSGSTDESAELTALVVAYYHALPPKQRLVFERADLRGISCADIARDLDMRPSTVRAHLFKARTNIRRRLLKHHETLVRDYQS